MSIRRQDILDSMKTRFQNIFVANGYHSNLGANVYLWKATTIEPTNLPAAVIRDHLNTRIMEGQGGRGGTAPLGLDTWELEIDVNIICSSGSTTDAVARQLIADSYKAIGVDDTWGGKAMTSFLNTDEIIYDDQQENKIIGVSVKFNVLYRTQKYQEQ